MHYFSILPPPTQTIWDRDDERREQQITIAAQKQLVIAQPIAPPYGQRRGWIPRQHTDFGGNNKNNDFSILICATLLYL